MNLEIRIHGRGGQGVVTAAELLAVAAFEQGLHAQALPSFGSERTGAPVTAGCRISDRRIRSHDPISHPDVVVVQDLSLLRDPAILAGLEDDGVVVVNTGRGLGDLVDGPALRPGQRWVSLPANELARELLGRPVPNTALVGAVAALTGALEPYVVDEAIRGRFRAAGGGVAEANVQLARRARELVTPVLEGSV